MANLLFISSLLAQVGLAVWAIAMTLRERATLGAWAKASTSAESAFAAAKDLPEPHRSIASEMAESVRVRSTLDDALVKAVIRAADEPWTPPFGVQAALHTVMVLLALGPATWSLVGATTALGTAQSKLSGVHMAQRYLEAPQLLDAPFAALRDGFGASAVLLAGLALVWALVWWLQRPQAREARLVGRLLEVATQIRPGTPAPVGGRLAALVAPDRDLSRPATATVLWVVAVTAAWAILFQTAGLRAENHREAEYVWAGPSRTPIKRGGTDLVPPTTRGGQPFEDLGHPTVSVGPTQVLFQGKPLTGVEDGRLSAPLEAPASEIVTLLRTKGAVTVLAHHDLDMQEGLLPVLYWLYDHGGVGQFHMLVLRDLAGGEAQADLRLQMVAARDGEGLALEVAADELRVGAAAFPAKRDDWRRLAAERIRAMPPLFDPKTPAAAWVRVGPGTDYARFAAALGAADDSCTSKRDCGLPGLGLQFKLTR